MAYKYIHIYIYICIFLFWHSNWQSFPHILWHSLWHSFWHCIWHLVSHSFWHSIMAFSDMGTADLNRERHSSVGSGASGWGPAVGSGKAHWHLELAVRQCPLRSSRDTWNSRWGRAHWDLESAAEVLQSVPLTSGARRDLELAVPLTSGARGWGPPWRVGSGSAHWDRARGWSQCPLRSGARGWGLQCQLSEIWSLWLRSGCAHFEIWSSQVKKDEKVTLINLETLAWQVGNKKLESMIWVSGKTVYPPNGNFHQLQMMLDIWFSDKPFIFISHYCTGGPGRYLYNIRVKRIWTLIKTQCYLVVPCTSSFNPWGI